MSGEPKIGIQLIRNSWTEFCDTFSFLFSRKRSPNIPQKAHGNSHPLRIEITSWWCRGVWVYPLETWLDGWGPMIILNQCGNLIDLWSDWHVYKHFGSMIIPGVFSRRMSLPNTGWWLSHRMSHHHILDGWMDGIGGLLRSEWLIGMKHFPSWLNTNLPADS